MLPVLFWVSGHPVVSWTVCAMIGSWVAYFSLTASLARSRIPAWQVTVFFVGCLLVWFAGAWLGQSLTVGRADVHIGFHRIELAGYVLYGGVIATIIFGFAAWLGFGWRRKLLVQELWDAGALALAWVLFFGRIGCTLYGCCYGTPAGSWPGYVLNDSRWDVINHAFPPGLLGVKLHPATLYEAFGLLAIVGALHWMRRTEERRPGSFPPGVPGWVCWISYGVIRFLVEFIRQDPRGEPILGLSPSQLIAICTVLVGAGLIQWDWRMKRKPLLSSQPLV
jgi:phosphatidylglycerol:prolipoprotein diacylglycerol transferase